MSQEVKLAGLMLTTSPTKCQLVSKKYGTSTIYSIHFNIHVKELVTLLCTVFLYYCFVFMFSGIESCVSQSCECPCVPKQWSGSGLWQWQDSVLYKYGSVSAVAQKIVGTVSECLHNRVQKSAVDCINVFTNIINGVLFKKQ